MKIIKEELEFEECLKQRLEFICEFAKVKPVFINGSIRKWYFDKNSRKDLNYFEFVNCIEILGSKLGLKKGEIWKNDNENHIKVTQIVSVK